MSSDQSEISYATGVLVPASWQSERWPRPIDRVLELRRDEMLCSDMPIASAEDLKGALGVKNHRFLSARHRFAYRIKDIVEFWGVPGPKISTAINGKLLPKAVKLHGTGKQIVTAAMIDYMFSNRSGVHGLETLCADRNLISTEPGLKLSFSGTGSSSEDAIT